MTAQKPNLAVCVQAPLAVTCDQFVFDDLGKLLQYHCSYCIILLFLRMFEGCSPASIESMVADIATATAVKAITNLPCLHSAASRYCLVEDDKVERNGVASLITVWCMAGEERQGGTVVMEEKKISLWYFSWGILFCWQFRLCRNCTAELKAGTESLFTCGQSSICSQLSINCLVILPFFQLCW